MFVIINEDREFYSHTKDGGIEFTTNFSMADMFHSQEDAMREWDENGTDEISVIIESV